MEIPILYKTVDFSELPPDNRHANEPFLYNIRICDPVLEMSVVRTSLEQIGFKYMLSIGEGIRPAQMNSSFLGRFYLLCCLSESYQLSGTAVIIYESMDGAHQQKTEILSGYFSRQATSARIVCLSGSENVATNGIAYLTVSSNPLTGSEGVERIVVGDFESWKQQEGLEISAVIRSAGDLAQRNYQSDEIGRWKKRAALYLSFIPLSKRVVEKEYYELKDWYHKEYEALPVWFKRAGHLLKVVTGKRTFRSLFDDKVKRHKGAGGK